MVPACTELTAQRRKHPVPASHLLEGVGWKGDPLAQLEKEGGQDKGSWPDTVAPQHLVRSTHGLSVKHAETLFQSVWAVRCPGVCSVLGDSEAGDLQATLGEIVMWGEKRVCAEAER